MSVCSSSVHAAQRASPWEALPLDGVGEPELEVAAAEGVATVADPVGPRHQELAAPAARHLGLREPVDEVASVVPQHPQRRAALGHHRDVARRRDLVLLAAGEHHDGHPRQSWRPRQSVETTRSARSRVLRGRVERLLVDLPAQPVLTHRLAVACHAAVEPEVGGGLDPHQHPDVPGDRGRPRADALEHEQAAGLDGVGLGPVVGQPVPAGPAARAARPRGAPGTPRRSPRARAVRASPRSSSSQWTTTAPSTDAPIAPASVVLPDPAGPSTHTSRPGPSVGGAASTRSHDRAARPRRGRTSRQKARPQPR